MNAVNELEAMEVVRHNNAQVERRRPWLLSETEIEEDKRRHKADNLFLKLQRYFEQVNFGEQADYL
jgi:hypothetical protein